ncbi:MAG: M6 family metalloprotease domain-containing protein, partial [Prevotellaceae bacterium]|nr:M6 family metalloprotease domain-containing protein [Prevotellaceae bacterium]
RSTAIAGTIKALVILVNFSDKQFVVPNAQQVFSNLLNQHNYIATNGAVGSVRDYFIDNSFGTFQPQFDVYGPYNLPDTMGYYGRNMQGSTGYDQNPDIMVQQACALAYANGVNFSQYDSNGDGVVDQVFVYYAGNNEAEGGPANTIWPHRHQVYYYVGSGANRMLISDYACSSELRSTGTTSNFMCGIGTFTHEFGHILGLPDFYATNNAMHHTLNYWDIMDIGCYLNNGFTPAAYSSYERFFLGWLTPRVLDAPENAQLNPLNTSNEALMVTATNTSNLNGTNPNPRLFYMLENRQKTGWDSFLPGHGLLLTKINYNAGKWANNSVNNTSSSMGVDIIEADGLANDNPNTLSGDPFPGTTNVRAYNIVFDDVTTRSLSEINETNNIITFKFMGGTTPTENLTTDDLKIFTANEKLFVTTQNNELQTITIFDIFGRQVFSSGFYNSFETNTNDFPAGIYFVKAGNSVAKVRF